MKNFCTLLAVLAALVVAASAQVNVNIEVKRRNYVRYEPLLTTVTITNLSGRDLLLEDGASPWFSFTVLQGDSNTLVPPRAQDYKLDPLELKIGETVKRTVNLNQLYPISEYGIYRIRATIYVKALDKYATSRTANINICEGQTVFKQTVGVPDTLQNAGKMHDVMLLTSQMERHNYLYCRILDPDTGNVLCMQKLGHTIDGSQFDAQFDSTNTLHVLQLVGPKTYALSQIGVNGELYGQWIYDAPKVKPYLRRDNTGSLEIVGAMRRVEAAKNSPAAPKLSDRPAGLPR